MFLIAMTIVCFHLIFWLSAESRAVFNLDFFSTQFQEQRSWAQYSPWFPVQSYTNIPIGCEISQVNILQRHGARFPTTGASTSIISAVAKLQDVSEYTDSKLDFLHQFIYDLGTDSLVPFGAMQSYEAGADHFYRYEELVSIDRLPFVRASSSQRVVDSATNWTAGFQAASQFEYSPTLSVILPEELNDTLDDAMCPNAGGSSLQTNTWLHVYAPPIRERLNAAALGANLTDEEVYSLLSLCAFHTLAKEEESPFCELFSIEEFEAFEYSGDLDKYYNTGYGQPLGPVQGVGYVNELIARLTNSPVEDNTQTNRTLDADPATFPLNRTIYADFSHDNQMIAIYAAMGLFRQSIALSTTSPQKGRDWLASHLVPFSSRMITEKITCGADEYVRILVNEAVQPLEFCGGKNGLCTVEAFVESQLYSKNNGNGDFERCFTDSNDN